MIDSGNGQAQSAKVNPTQNQFSLNRPESRQILLINTIGFLVASLSATFLDARLTTHFFFGHARSYPLGYYIAFFAPLFPLVTYVAMAWAKGRSEKMRWACACLPSVFVAAPFLWNFRPEIPHIGFCIDVGSYSLLAFLTAMLEDAARLPRNDLHATIRNRHIEESIKDWRNLLFIAATSYLVLAVYWLQLLWTIAGLTVRLDSEKWLFGIVMSVKVLIFSVFVLTGPIASIFRGLKTHQEQLGQDAPPTPPVQH